MDKGAALLFVRRRVHVCEQKDNSSTIRAADPETPSEKIRTGFLLNKSVKGPAQKTHVVPRRGICRATRFYCWSSAEPETGKVEPSHEAHKDQPRQYGKTFTVHAAQTRRTRDFPQVRSADRLESGQKLYTNSFIKPKGPSACDSDKIKKKKNRPGSGSEPFNCSLNNNNDPENDQHYFCYQSLLSDVFNTCLACNINIH